MAKDEAEDITFSYALSDFDEEQTLVDDDAGCDEILGTFKALVVRLDERRFRVAEPVSVTPFGILGPRLNLGDVIEATPEDEGRYRYVRRVECALVKTLMISPMTKPIFERDEVVSILDRITEAGGVWEWTPSNLIVQIPLKDGEGEALKKVTELVHELSRVTKEGDLDAPHRNRISKRRGHRYTAVKSGVSMWTGAV